jgi:hypothetical protein
MLTIQKKAVIEYKKFEFISFDLYLRELIGEIILLFISDMGIFYTANLLKLLFKDIVNIYYIYEVTS